MRSRPFARRSRTASPRHARRAISRRTAATTPPAPPRPEWRRPEWDDPVFDFVGAYLPQSATVVREKHQQVVDHLRELPRGRDEYGLTHQDAHGANMHVGADGRLTLFDFDDCGYHWFANDIAVCLFYTAMGRNQTPEFARTFLANFLKGYREENRLADWWLAEIPNFLKLREIELYAVIHRDFDVERGGLAAIDDEWCANYMAGRKERIEAGVPWVEIAA
jgi:Ser/Thr protein kinase RdoA (MazF antagonist)